MGDTTATVKIKFKMYNFWGKTAVALKNIVLKQTRIPLLLVHKIK